MSEQLKPCPFCGGEAQLSRDDSDDPIIRCLSCLVTMGEAGGGTREVVASWNKRADAYAAGLKAGAEAMREEAAKVCENLVASCRMLRMPSGDAEFCRNHIRALPLPREWK